MFFIVTEWQAVYEQCATLCRTHQRTHTHTQSELNHKGWICPYTYHEGNRWREVINLSPDIFSPGK